MPPGDDGILRRLRAPLIGILVTFLTGVVGYLVLGFPFVDALTNTVLVLTTVGFSTRGPLTSVDKVFTDVIAILGVSAYLAMLTLSAVAISEGRFGIASRRRRVEKRVGRQRDHYIVCAYGRVGRAAAAEFAAARVPFVVMDRLGSLEDRMRADGVLYLIGDPTEEDMLRRAGIQHARGLVSAVDSDASNVFITLTARALNPDLFIVARGSESAAADRLYRANADRVISPYVSSGRHMARLAIRPRLVDYLEIRGVSGTTLRLEEIRVTGGSHLVGEPLHAACGRTIPLVLRRASGELFAPPPPDLKLEGEDLIVLLGDPAALATVEESA